MTINDTKLPTIAFVPGDCTGIGPEQTARVLAEGKLADVAHLVVVGDARVLEMGMAHAGVRFAVERISSPCEANWHSGAVQLVDLANTDPALFPLGKASAESGRLTGETLARAIDFAKAGEVDAITFAPLNKRAMFDGGWKFPDEHKMFAHLLGHESYFSEMNVLDGQWMSRVTGHQSSATRSATQRASGPAVSRVAEIGTIPACGQRCTVGRNPHVPQNADGTRTDPPVSLPMLAGTSRAPTAAPEPPLEPPGILPAS